MEIDKAVLELLPLHHRQKLVRQLRQEQLKRYNEWIENNKEEEPRSPRNEGKKKAKKKGVSFQKEATVWDVISGFNDKECKCFSVCPSTFIFF